jgi:hypothetical protein
MRSRNRKPPSLSAKLKLRNFKKDLPEIKPVQKYTQAEIKKLFKNWR